MNVFVYEDVVEYDEIRQCPVPGIILEDRGWLAPTAIENDMRRMLGRETLSLDELTRRLESAGVQVVSARPIPPSLEDVFIDKIAASSGVATADRGGTSPRP